MENKYDALIKECNFLLNSYPAAEEAKDYLKHRVNAETQDKFLFGYFPNESNLTALFDNLHPHELEHLQLSYTKEYFDASGKKEIRHSFFENHPLIMPYRNVYGEIIAIVGRSVLEEEQRLHMHVAKYKNTIFTKGNHLFGLFENKKEVLNQDCVYLVEGQFDVIKSYEKGMRNVVALGSSNLSQNQFALLTRYTNNIFLLLDNDDAGRLGRERILKKYSELANIRNFYLPRMYKDLDSFFQENELSKLTLSTYF